MTTWRKSSRSAQGDCAEVVAWRKSSRSTHSGNCVLVAGSTDSGGIAVRDSKDPDGPVLLVSPSAWQAFTDSVKSAAAS